MRSAPLWQHEQTHVAVRPPPGKTSGQPPFVTPADTKRARWFSGALGSAAAIALFAMMVLTFADVFSRKFLGNSINGINLVWSGFTFKGAYSTTFAYAVSSG